VDNSRQRGYSLVEVLVATLVFSAAMAGVLTLVSETQRSYARENSIVDAVWQGRAAIDLMVRELRMAGYPPKNTYVTSAGLTAGNSNLVAATFITAAAADVVFEADLDGDGIVERLEYCLNGTTLMRSALPKNANGSAPSPVYQTVAENVANGTTAVFQYTTDPLSIQAFPGNVSSVGILLVLRTANPDPKTRQYRSFRFEGTAYRMNPDR